MPAAAIPVLMLLLVAAIVAATLSIGAPILALPIVFLALVIWGGGRVGTARGQRRALGEDEEPIEFTAEDRRTLTPPSSTPPGRPGSEPAS
ncbi:MAG TPA: hypothetical protein VF517_07465 [Thermoleophilaceae bacterium]|jgi:hypothetical protein